MVIFIMILNSGQTCIIGIICWVFSLACFFEVMVKDDGNSLILDMARVVLILAKAVVFFAAVCHLFNLLIVFVVIELSDWSDNSLFVLDTDWKWFFFISDYCDVVLAMGALMFVEWLVNFGDWFGNSIVLSVFGVFLLDLFSKTDPVSNIDEQQQKISVLQ